jgi:hypothetical protein
MRSIYPILSTMARLQSLHLNGRRLLRVARSLADQICEAEHVAAEDRGEEDGDHESNNQLPSLPPPGTSWADRVHVYLSSENGGDVNKLHFSIANAESTPTADKG